jgi:hypothetical protein
MKNGKIGELNRRLLSGILLVCFLLGAVLGGCGGGGGGSDSNTPSNQNAPAGLIYRQGAVVYPLGEAIVPNTPSTSGGTITQFSVTPALPAGLSLDPTSGIISGTPTAVKPATIYSITGSNNAGLIIIGLQLEVREKTIAPASLNYLNASVNYPIGDVIEPNTPIATGGAITRFSVTPALPAGLSLNPNTGVISGMPTAAKPSAIYTVTGTNSAGSVTARLQLEVTEKAISPVSLSYLDASVSYPAGAPIDPNRPISTGGQITQFRVAPALPAGLSLDTTSGIISGTPSLATPAAAYTVTGSNSAGSIATQLNIAITERMVAPASLTYADAAPPISYTVNQPIVPNTPITMGGTITQFSITPTLPAGLNLDITSGVINGTPTVASPLTVYTVIGSNSAGSVSTQLSIETLVVQ